MMIQLSDAYMHYWGVNILKPKQEVLQIEIIMKMRLVELLREN